jgi:transcriptional regulator with XRE-family HTH domain
MNTKYNFDVVRFSVTIELLCQQSDLTIAQIAELAGIGTSTLYAIKNGSKCPTIAELTHICNLFNLDPRNYFKKA